MIGQLRIYTINAGMMDSWLKAFEEDIVPRLKEAGMGVHTAWVNEDRTQFIWIRTCDSVENIEIKEAALYGTDWWAANVDRLRAHHAHREVKIIEPFLPDGA